MTVNLSDGSPGVTQTGARVTMPLSIQQIRDRVAQLPRVPLALTPTPLEEAPRNRV